MNTKATSNTQNPVLCRENLIEKSMTSHWYRKMIPEYNLGRLVLEHYNHRFQYCYVDPGRAMAYKPL